MHRFAAGKQRSEVRVRRVTSAEADKGNIKGNPESVILTPLMFLF